MRKTGPFKSLLTIALSVAWVFAGFRNLPRLSHPQSAAAGCIIAVCILLAYRAGSRSVKAEAIATAVARAEATALAAVQATTESTANAQVLIINDTARGARARGQALGLDDAPWLAGAHRAIDLDETEALDAALEDVLTAREEEQTS